MFCDNCGRQLNDGAKFCDSCGARVGGADAQPVNQGYVQNTPQNMMYTQPAYMAPVQTARKPKSRAWIIIIIAVVVAAGIGVALFLLLSPATTLTVNGENIPVEVSGYSLVDSTCIVEVVGKKGNDKYFVNFGFPGDNLSAGKTYEPEVGFMHKNDEENIFYNLGITEATVSVDDYSEKEKIGISVSGEISFHGVEYEGTEYDGLEYKFSFSGNVEYCAYSDLMKRATKIFGRLSNF